ncbi:MAG: hypothetical protein J1F22_03285 [Lachnospiraceae bacterium]|nr:hypothetical protein [Lachnospiraceae bacterium]
MKKNILTIVIMASTLINLILSAVLVFSVMPAMNKTSNLVDKVASVIDLEIEDEADKGQDYTIADLVTYPIEYDTSVKINLLKEGNESHYAILDGIVISFNTKADDYESVYESVQNASVYIEDIVSETIGSYTYSNINEAQVKAEAIKKIQERYNTKSIVEISLPGFLTA